MRLINQYALPAFLLALLILLTSIGIYRLLFPQQVEAIFQKYQRQYVHLYDDSDKDIILSILDASNIVDKESVHFTSKAMALRNLSDLVSLNENESDLVSPFIGFNFVASSSKSDQEALMESLSNENQVVRVNTDNSGLLILMRMLKFISLLAIVLIVILIILRVNLMGGSLRHQIEEDKKLLTLLTLHGLRPSRSFFKYLRPTIILGMLVVITLLLIYILFLLGQKFTFMEMLRQRDPHMPLLILILLSGMSYVLIDYLIGYKIVKKTMRYDS